MNSNDRCAQLKNELKEGYKSMHHLNLCIAEEHFLMECEVEIKYTAEIGTIILSNNRKKDGE
ncbi:MAG TPA: hypothetical protein VK068_04505 [Jeotgalicoccus sp.]|uniref:Uncharacterized protein n=1 Tax=Phocicoccus schoeneichii TaxID=1812261 RepID=A0A6V7R533_9BACL|nr:hypothetical protein [Jeotgalicoccus schoeneichii]GGH53540.1 hypothetical protein GCM10007358_12980 [Jeotgalicoccus schoeneichii]CAD2072154.1 hypothetical protein JEOSCH030_00167 [Jeotgalicoccus schoeneichii]HLR39642.1 hypothetical protein [Jeotgalicoccus sp.]